MRRSIVLAFLALAGTACASDVTVKVSAVSERTGTFVHSTPVSGADALRLQSPTALDLKPYLLAARKALAEREGYTDHLYGPSSWRLLTGFRVAEVVVVDGATGRVAYSTRDPLESEPGERMTRATASRARPFASGETGAPEPSMDDAGFAPGARRGGSTPAAPGRGRMPSAAWRIR